MGNVLTLLLFVLPLGVDTFAIAAAVGANRISGWSRWRISTIFAICEGGTPLIGLGLGSSVGQAVGDIAEYFSGFLLILLGGYLWWSDDDDGGDDDDDEVAKARRLIDARGLTLIGLAISISIDELAIGFSFGLGATLAEPTTIVAIIAIQALVVSQLGLSLGARISEHLRERIERIAGPILIFLGFYPLAEAFIRTNLIPPRAATIISTLVIVLAAIIIYRRLAGQTHTDPAVPFRPPQLPAFATATGQLNKSEPLHPRSSRDHAIAASRSEAGRHRAHPGVSPPGRSARDYGSRHHTSDEAVRSGYGMGNHRGS
jgi:manganese efflux pump family protein